MLICFFLWLFGSKLTRSDIKRKTFPNSSNYWQHVLAWASDSWISLSLSINLLICQGHEESRATVRRQLATERELRLISRQSDTRNSSSCLIKLTFCNVYTNSFLAAASFCVDLVSLARFKFVEATTVNPLRRLLEKPRYMLITRNSFNTLALIWKVFGESFRTLPDRKEGGKIKHHLHRDKSNSF